MTIFAPTDAVEAAPNRGSKPQLEAQLDVRGALAHGIRKLEAAGISPAALTAELLLLHAVKRDRTWLYAHPERVLTAAETASYEYLLIERVSGVPTQHLTGEQEFWGLLFEVTPNVLIPRPETEHLIEVALARLGVPAKTMPLRIADVGTGSGCLAVTLGLECPHARIVATDISTDALEIASRNAARHNVGHRVEFAQTNLLDFYCGHSSPASQSARPFDLIVSNPPYIARSDSAQLPREVRDHEPHAALFAGETGDELYAPLIRQAETLLRTGGVLAVEVGFGAAARIRSLFKDDAWSDVAVERDLAGIDRVVSAARRAA